MNLGPPVVFGWSFFMRGWIARTCRAMTMGRMGRWLSATAWAVFGDGWDGAVALLPPPWPSPRRGGRGPVLNQPYGAGRQIVDATDNFDAAGGDLIGNDRLGCGQPVDPQ